MGRMTETDTERLGGSGHAGIGDGEVEFARIGYIRGYTGTVEYLDIFQRVDHAGAIVKVLQC